MNILFDLKTPQHFIGGAGEYIRKVFYSLIQKIKDENLNIVVIGLYDSRVGLFSYYDLAPNYLNEKSINTVDIAKTSLKEIICSYNIDLIFIGCAQYWSEYDLNNINCRLICVVHDLCNEEYDCNKIIDYVNLRTTYNYIRYKIHQIIHKSQSRKNDKLFKVINSNKKTKLITVSNYSKYSIEYHYKITPDKIIVLYSPFRLFIESKKDIQDIKLKEIILSKKKYFLLLSANRPMKNAYNTIEAFKEFVNLNDDAKDFYLVTVGYNKVEHKHHVDLPYLNEFDLQYAMENCYAFLFPSFFEGFGYPPVEAMKYEKPILCSNVTSIPEIVGDAGIYFSPFYKTDIFKAFSVFKDSNYLELKRKSKKRFEYLSSKQEMDLNKLIDIIVSN